MTDFLVIRLAVFLVKNREAMLFLVMFFGFVFSVYLWILVIFWLYSGAFGIAY
jgi:hypothetical protein